MKLDVESGLNLDHDEGAVVSLVAERGARIDRDDRIGDGDGDAAVYWVTARPRAQPSETFIARVEWFSYPYEPPSIKFATSVRGSLTEPKAWPIIPGYRPQNLDICRPMCREGFATHPEWAQGSTAWPTVGNPFLWVVELLLYQLDNEYERRFS